MEERSSDKVSSERIERSVWGGRKEGGEMRAHQTTFGSLTRLLVAEAREKWEKQLSRSVYLPSKTLKYLGTEASIRTIGRADHCEFERVPNSRRPVLTCSSSLPHSSVMRQSKPTRYDTGDPLLKGLIHGGSSRALTT